MLFTSLSIQKSGYLYIRKATCSRCTNSLLVLNEREIPSRRGWVAEWAECQTEKPGALLMQVWFPGVPRDISPRVKFQRKLLQHLHSPYTQSHTSVCMCTLKIPKDASHTTDRIHKNTAYTGRNGQHCARHKTIHPQPKTRHQGNTQTTTHPVHVSSTPWNTLFPKTAFLWRFHSSNTWVVKRRVQLSLFIAC